MAVGIVAVVHCASVALVREPIARPELRGKVASLTRAASPVLVIAGDSRAKCGLDPVAVGARLGLDPVQTVNLGVDGCGTWSVLSAYREFVDRFAPSPILVISVSPFSVNDATGLQPEKELLWSLSIRDRLRIASPGMVVQSWFLPERAFCDRLESMWVPQRPYARRGFEPYVMSHSQHFRQSGWEAELNEASKLYFGNGDVQGVRWARLEQDLAGLKSSGAQLVLIDLPYHPDLEQMIRGTPQAQALRAFENGLETICRQLDIPLLRYRTSQLPDGMASGVFYDSVHLNPAGADIYSSIVADDLQDLRIEGRITLAPRADRFAMDGSASPGVVPSPTTGD